MSLAVCVNENLEPIVWKKTLEEPIASYPPLDGDRECDLVVIGAGFCGLNIALHAAKSGLHVIVLEAGRVGCGASGRNGGYNVPHFPGAMTISTVIKTLGVQKGEALAELVLNGADFVFNQAEELQINCASQQKGWVQPAHSQKSLAKIRQVYQEWQAFGAKVDWYGAAEINEHLGTQGYLGGWSNARGGTLNPYALTLGLARAVANQGVEIFEMSAADTVEQAAGSAFVSCGNHRIKAKKAIFATNAYSGDFLPQVQRSVVPVHLFHAATKPLRQELRATILKTGVCFTDLRKSGGFCRLDAAGRMISGGAVLAMSNARSYGENHARKRLRLLFPQLAEQDVEIETYWQGYCAISNSYLPHFQQLGQNIFAIAGFSTRGVNLAQNIGRLIGEWAAEKRLTDDIPILVTARHEKITFWPLKTLAARYIFPFYQMRDYFGLS